MDDPSALPGDAAGARRQRGRPRDSMMLQAAVRSLGGSGEAVLRVRNLSAGGLMADLAGGFAIGEPVEVELRNIGPVRGVVAWARDERLGISFDAAIDPKLARKPVGAAPRADTRPPAPWRPGIGARR